MNNDLPYNEEAERGVLGACLIDNERCLDLCLDRGVNSAWFYLPAHRLLWEQLVRMEDANCDLITAGTALKASGALEKAGGYSFLEGLIDSTPTAAHCGHYLDLVEKDYKRRKIIAAAAQAMSNCYDGDPDDVLAELDGELTDTACKREERSLPEIMAENKTVLDNAMRGHTSGLELPWKRFSLSIGGVQRASVVPLVGRDGKGKCFGKNTEIRMYDGTVKYVQDIRDGDKVMGWDSKPRTVLGTTSGVADLYRIEQKDGTSFVCNGDHILVLEATSKCSSAKHIGDEANVSVSDWMKWAQRNKHNYMGVKVGVEYPQRNLPVEPYFLGLWLGDGRKRSEEITTNDKEIVSYLLSYAKRLGLRGSVSPYANSNAVRVTITNGCMQLREQPLVTKLRQIGVINNKHIPSIYMRSCRSQRIKLLAGLIDSDGWAGSGNSYVFTNTDGKLANQVAELSRSLGFRTKIFSKVARGFGVECVSFNVTISGFISQIPVRVKRKIRGDSKLTRNKFSINGKPIGVGEYYGFQVDGDHKFLLADYTVTHNSGMLAQIVDHWAGLGIPVLCFSFEDVSRRFLLRMGGCREWYSAISVETGLVKFSDRWAQMCEEEKARHDAKLDSYTEFLGNAPLWIYERRMTVEEMCAKIRHHHRTNRIQAVTIDGFKDIIPSKGTGQTECERHIALKLQETAKETGVCIITVSHIHKIDDDKPISKMNIMGSSVQFQGARQVLIFQDAGIDGVDGVNTFALDSSKANFARGGMVLLRRDEDVLCYTEV